MIVQATDGYFYSNPIILSENCRDYIAFPEMENAQCIIMRLSDKSITSKSQRRKVNTGFKGFARFVDVTGNKEMIFPPDWTSVHAADICKVEITGKIPVNRITNIKAIAKLGQWTLSLGQVGNDLIAFDWLFTKQDLIDIYEGRTTIGKLTLRGVQQRIRSVFGVRNTTELEDKDFRLPLTVFRKLNRVTRLLD